MKVYVGLYEDQPLIFTCVGATLDATVAALLAIDGKECTLESLTETPERWIHPPVTKEWSCRIRETERDWSMTYAIQEHELHGAPTQPGHADAASPRP